MTSVDYDDDMAHIAEISGVKFYLGTSYLLKDPTPARLYNLYNTLVEKVDTGLCISRTFPQKVINQFNISKGSFVWMTTNTVGYDKCVSPTNISMLHMNITDFLRTTESGIVTIDGVEYLVSNNGFDPILRLLHSINDKVTVSSHMLLVTVDEQTLSQREMRIMEKDFEQAI